MSAPLQTGVDNQAEHVVTEEMTPRHLLPAVVLSTPKMIELMEQCCLEAVEARLEDGETTVGTHVNVSHEAAALGGETVSVRCRLTDIDRRRLTFEVSATVEDRVIGEGVHERFVVDRSRYG
ncbi:MAG: thioesterase family protein [Acidimicrobiia bacterium]